MNISQTLHDIFTAESDHELALSDLQSQRLKLYRDWSQRRAASLGLRVGMVVKLKSHRFPARITGFTATRDPRNADELLLVVEADEIGGARPRVQRVCVRDGNGYKVAKQH